ncbi:TLDc domain-containing protein [Entamoeba marina]
MQDTLSVQEKIKKFNTNSNTTSEKPKERTYETRQQEINPTKRLDPNVMNRFKKTPEVKPVVRTQQQNKPPAGKLGRNVMNKFETTADVKSEIRNEPIKRQVNKLDASLINVYKKRTVETSESRQQVTKPIGRINANLMDKFGKSNEPKKEYKPRQSTKINSEIIKSIGNSILPESLTPYRISLPIKLLNKTKERMETDEELKALKNSLEVIKKLCKSNDYVILFDSAEDGDGSNRVLRNKVFGKRKLCFLTWDNSDNCFGGYVRSTITTDNVQDNISDKNAFLFSLIRNGLIVKDKFKIKEGEEDHAFYLMDGDGKSLYGFGGIGGCVRDVRIFSVGCEGSFFNSKYFSSNENYSFVDVTYPDTFAVKRIIVIQMDEL